MATYGYEIVWVSDGQGGERADVRVGPLLVRLRVWRVDLVNGDGYWVASVRRVVAEEEATMPDLVAALRPVDDAPGCEIVVDEPLEGHAGASLKAMRAVAVEALVRVYGLPTMWDLSASSRTGAMEKLTVETVFGDLVVEMNDADRAEARAVAIESLPNGGTRCMLSKALLLAEAETSGLRAEAQRLRDHVACLRAALAVDQETRAREEMCLIPDPRARPLFRMLDALRALNSGALSDGDATTVATRALDRVSRDARAVAQDYAGDLCLFYARAATTALHPTLPIVDRLEARVDEAALRRRLEAHLDGQDDRRAAIGWLAARVALLTPERYAGFVRAALQDRGPLDDLGLRRHTEALVTAADGPGAFDAGMYAAAVEDLMDMDEIQPGAGGGWALGG